MPRRAESPDPTDPTPAVEHPEVSDILDARSGRVSKASEYISNIQYRRSIVLRSALREAWLAKKSRILCAACTKPVFLKASIHRQYFFSHAVVKGSCPSAMKERFAPEEIRAMKYKGAQESVQHKRMKALLVSSLEADPEFKDIAIQKTWHATHDRRVLRYPDVSAKIGDLKVAFEAQVSTTSLNVVLERRAFYGDEGALLVWFLPRFDPNHRLVMHEDVLFNNNTNILVVNEATAEASRRQQRFVVECHYAEPISTSFGIHHEWRNKHVGWNELTLNPSKHLAYFFDCAGVEAEFLAEHRRAAEESAVAQRAEAERKSKARLLAAKQAQEAYRAELAHTLRRDMYNLFVHGKGTDGEPVQLWSVSPEAVAMKKRLLQFGIDFDAEPNWCVEFPQVAKCLAAAYIGRPVGYKFNSLVQFAHHIAQNVPYAVPLFEEILSRRGHSAVLADSDRNGSWNQRRSVLKIPRGPIQLIKAARLMFEND